MDNNTEKLTVRPYGIAAAGLGLSLVFWVVDSCIDAYFEHGDIADELFRPSSHELAIRGLALVVQIFFIIYLFRILARRRKLEEELERAVVTAEAERKRSEAIVAAMGDAVSIQDTDLKVLYQNQAHKEMMGAHEGEFCHAAYQGKEQACDGCHLVKSFRDGMVHRREASSLRPAGVLHVEIISSPLRDGEGKIIAGIETVRDITQRKAMENLLKEQMTAIENSMDGIAILDAGGEYTYLNQAHARIYGYDDPAELIGKGWPTLYREREVSWFEREVLPELTSTGKWRGESLGRKRDGSLFPQELSLNRLENGGGICVVRDISARKKAEDEIRRLNDDLTERARELSLTNRDLEAFNYSLSHDMRTPLTRIYTAAQALEERYGERLDSEGNFFVRTLVEACEGMEELIEAMLILGRVSRSEMNVQEFDLGELAGTVAAEIQIAHGDRGAEFVIPVGIMATGDPQLMRVALENLLGNAWKYTSKSERPRIEFGVNGDREEKVYFVRDNGVGFDPSQSDRLFKPFQRLHRSAEFPGTGIGLATVKRIIERHGGTIRAEGESGRGATFFFTLG